MRVSTIHKTGLYLLIVLGTMLSACGGKDGQSDEKVAVDPADAGLKISWQILSAVTFEDRYFPDLDEYLLFPAFDPSVKVLHGKAIQIEGYVIPVEPGRYVLSANPFSSCFFCGGAGPESVMELELVQPGAVYFTDEFKTFSGTLALNDTDVDKLNYILQDAVAVTPTE